VVGKSKQNLLSAHGELSHTSSSGLSGAFWGESLDLWYSSALPPWPISGYQLDLAVG
jgi:hypothetical protein